MALETIDATWRHHEVEGFLRYQALPSPPLAPCASPLSEYASFLPPISKFSLDDDIQPRVCPAERGCGITQEKDEQTGISDEYRPIILRRQHSEELHDIVQSAFDEMDTALSHRPPPRDAPQLNIHAPEFVPSGATFDANMDCEPNQEEQAWLDAQVEAMEQIEELENREAWVQELLTQHPTLPVDEAHRLWDLECSWR